MSDEKTIDQIAMEDAAIKLGHVVNSWSEPGILLVEADPKFESGWRARDEEVRRLREALEAARYQFDCFANAKTSDMGDEDDSLDDCRLMHIDWSKNRSRYLEEKCRQALAASPGEPSETVAVPREKLERWMEAVHESWVDARPCSGSLWDEMEAALRERGEGGRG